MSAGILSNNKNTDRNIGNQSIPFNPGWGGGQKPPAKDFILHPCSSYAATYPKHCREAPPNNALPFFEAPFTSSSHFTTVIMQPRRCGFKRMYPLWVGDATSNIS